MFYVVKLAAQDRAVTTGPIKMGKVQVGLPAQPVLKVRQEAVDAFYKLADQHGWVLGETFERAVIALETELGKLSNGF